MHRATGQTLDREAGADRAHLRIASLNDKGAILVLRDIEQGLTLDKHDSATLCRVTNLYFRLGVERHDGAVFEGNNARLPEPCRNAPHAPQVKRRPGDQGHGRRSCRRAAHKHHTTRRAQHRAWRERRRIEIYAQRAGAIGVKGYRPSFGVCPQMTWIDRKPSLKGHLLLVGKRTPIDLSCPIGRNIVNLSARCPLFHASEAVCSHP